MKKTTKKPTKKEVQKIRSDRAYAVASGVMLLTHVDRTPVTVHVSPNESFYRPEYNPTDMRMWIATTIAELAIDHISENRAVESDLIYNKLISLDDPNCFLDRMTTDEVMMLVHTTLHMLTMNWYNLEAIAEQLLACTEETMLCFPPSKYSLTQ